MNPHSCKSNFVMIRLSPARSSRCLVWRLALAAGLLCAAAARAQSGRGYELKHSAFTGGSGSATNSSYRLTASFNPSKTGVATNGGYSLAGNFPGIYVVQTPGAPLLSITRSGTGFVLAWPNPSTGFKLQSTASLTTPDWADVALPVVVTGGNKTVTVPPAPADSMSYYRLMKP